MSAWQVVKLDDGRERYRLQMPTARIGIYDWKGNRVDWIVWTADGEWEVMRGITANAGDAKHASLFYVNTLESYSQA